MTEEAISTFNSYHSLSDHKRPGYLILTLSPADRGRCTTCVAAQAFYPGQAFEAGAKVPPWDLSPVTSKAHQFFRRKIVRLYGVSSAVSQSESHVSSDTWLHVVSVGKPEWTARNGRDILVIDLGRGLRPSTNCGSPVTQHHLIGIEPFIAKHSKHC